MKCLLLLVSLAITGISYSQIGSVVIPKSGKSIGEFIPAGYDTIAVEKGDLNKDKVDDVVIVLAHNDEKKEIEDIHPDSIPSRILVVLFNTGSSYNLSAVADSAILCKYCGGVFGEPFEGIEIDRNVLKVYHYGGSNWKWSYTHKYRYQQNDFYLIGETKSSFISAADCEEAGLDYKDVNLVTGDYEEKKVSSEDCKVLVDKKGKMKVKPLVKLSKFSINN